VASEHQQLVEAFVSETQETVRRLWPYIRALAEQPDREDFLSTVTTPCFRLFQAVKGNCTDLGFVHLAAPAAAMEYLLDLVLSGLLSLSPQRIALLAETCTFTEQGLALVRAEKSDARLASSADALTSAIHLAAATMQESQGDHGSNVMLPPEMQQSFLWEIETLLTAAEQECVLWDFIAIDLDRVADLCRMLLKLKQNFALYDFHEPERLCMAMESTLTRYIHGEVFQTEYPERVLLRCIDALRVAITRFPAVEIIAVPDLEYHLAAIQGLMRQPIGELLIEAGLVDSTVIDQALEVQRSTHAEQPRRLGEVLVAMGEVTPDQVQHVLHKQHRKRLRTEEAETALGGNESLFTLQSPITQASQEVRIDSRKLERMKVVLDRLQALPYSAEQEALLGELQALVKSFRREALSSLVNRLQRLVHDLAVQGNKRIHFSIEGIDILHETGNATQLAEVLFHLLRNGAEHGLESTEERLRLGKKKTGKLQVLVLRQGEEIMVSVEDDGRGFDFERVAALIVQRGLITEENVRNTTNRERLRFLLNPAVIAEDHGQGGSSLPGLLAVGRALQDIQGKVEVASRAGKGSCATVCIPRKR
jgi:two-component system, chemotaxis family, sensor kinase CheA